QGPTQLKQPALAVKTHLVPRGEPSGEAPRAPVEPIPVGDDEAPAVHAPRRAGPEPGPQAPGPETGQPGDQVRHVGAPADEGAAAAERRVVDPAGGRVAQLDRLDQ